MYKKIHSAMGPLPTQTNASWGIYGPLNAPPEGALTADLSAFGYWNKELSDEECREVSEFLMRQYKPSWWQRFKSWIF